MHDHDPIDEPCFLDYRDDPDLFEGKCERPSPPAGMTWWEGWWPTGGVNSIDDLEWWVELRLEQMISLQGYDTLADIGRMLGIQALKNADRYLGQFGKGDHPPRSPANQLQRVEDVEDALEGVLRYLRQRGQPTGATAPQSEPAASTGDKQPTPLRSWTQPKLDAAIREYAARRAGALKSLTEAVQANRKGAVESAREMFGRNEIARALGVKSWAMVTKSEAWKEIADELHLRPDPNKSRSLKNSDKIGFDKAADKKAIDTADPVAEEVERREAINLVRKKLKGKHADAIVDGLERGNISPEQAEEMVELVLDDKDDTRPRRPRR